MTDSEAETQRALGRVEGILQQVLDKLNAGLAAQIKHEEEDRKNFSQLRKLVYEQLEEQAKASLIEFEKRDTRIDELESDADKARGAGWVILGIISSCAAFVGTAVWALLKGHIKWVS